MRRIVLALLVALSVVVATAVTASADPWPPPVPTQGGAPAAAVNQPFATIS